MFQEPTELLLIGCSIELIWTSQNPNQIHGPKTNSQTYWQREISQVMNGIIFCVSSNISHLSSINCLDAMSKGTQEDASEERVTAKSKPMMNLVSRCSVRNQNVLASAASESPEKTKSESQKVPLSSLDEQQTRTGRLVMGASSSEHWRHVVFSRVEICWNVGSKNGETRRWQVCHRWWYGLWHRHRFEHFSKVTIILEQGEWSIAKDIGPLFKRCNARHRQTFFWIGNMYVFNIGSIYIHGKELLRKPTIHQKYRERFHLKRRTIWPVVCAEKFVDENTFLRPKILHKKIYCKSTKNEWKGSHNKIAW